MPGGNDVLPNAYYALPIAIILWYKYPTGYRDPMAQLTLSWQPRAASVDFPPRRTADPRTTSRQTSNRNTKLLGIGVTHTKQTPVLISNRNKITFCPARLVACPIPPAPTQEGSGVGKRSERRVRSRNVPLSNRNNKLLEIGVTYTKQISVVISNRNSFAFFASVRRAQASQFLTGTVNRYPLDACHGKISYLTFSNRDKFAFFATWGGSVLAAGGEERLQERSGVARANAGGDFDAVVDARMVEHGEARPHRAALGIVRAIDKARHAGLQDRAGAHRARLDGHVDDCSQQPMISDCRRSRAQRNHFRVGRGIAIRNRAIRGPRQDAVSNRNHAANRHFAAALGAARFFERHLHVHFIERRLRLPGVVFIAVHRASEYHVDNRQKGKALDAENVAVRASAAKALATKTGIATHVN